MNNLNSVLLEGKLIESQKGDNMRDYFLNHGLTKEEADILADYCERSGNTKERALDFADEILAEYVVRQSELSNAAAALGRKGGRVKSEKKAASCRENGKKGG